MRRDAGSKRPWMKRRCSKKAQAKLAKQRGSPGPVQAQSIRSTLLVPQEPQGKPIVVYVWPPRIKRY